MKKVALLVIGLLVVGILACNGAPEADQPISSPEAAPSATTELTAQEATNTPVLATAIPAPSPTPTMVPTIQTFAGRGQEATGLFTLNEGLARVDMAHTGDQNFIVWLLDSRGDEVDLLVNEIGPFNGSAALGIEQAGQYLLTVDADGAWEIVVTQ